MSINKEKTLVFGSRSTTGRAEGFFYNQLKAPGWRSREVEELLKKGGKCVYYCCLFSYKEKMATITTTVPFAVKEQHMDIKKLLKRYIDYVAKQDKSLNDLEIDFGKKGINAKEVLKYLKKIHE